MTRTGARDRSVERAFTLACALAFAACTPSLPESPAVPPGTYQVALPERVAASQRTYRIHVPPRRDPATPRPLLVALHGGGSSARNLERRSRLETLAARRGWLLVVPNGEGGLGLYRHWNAGSCCATAERMARDDVGFLRRVIDDVASRLPVDRSRVYLIGFSNGGMLAWRFATEHPERVAAVAVVAGTWAGATRRDEIPPFPAEALRVPLLLIYGQADERIPPEAVEVSLDAWVAQRDCGREPSSQWTHGARVWLREWPTCGVAGPVAAWALADWSHHWPARHRTRDRDDGLRGLDAGEIFDAFLARGSPRP